MYAPDSLLRVLVSTPVWVFTALTLTPGTSARDTSSTVPLIDELTCENAGLAIRRHNRPAAAPLEKTLVMFIETPPCFEPQQAPKDSRRPLVSSRAELKSTQTTHLRFRGSNTFH